ncbi:MAG: hypothetical protein HOI95_11910 [Chromatiales bacterium]|nr:hypothetical protein [Chromatiales bacterium]
MSITPPHDEPRDFPNGTLIGWVGLSIISVLFAMAFGYVARHALPSMFSPGAPFMQTAAISGALFLVIAVVAALAKRRGSPARKGFKAHVLWAGCGIVLVGLHSTGAVWKPAAALLVLLLFLAVLGGWARTGGARKMAVVFGSKRSAFTPLGTDSRQRLSELVQTKRGLLAQIDAQANEGLFSLRLNHWCRHPVLSSHYAKAVKAEHDLLGTRQSVESSLANWRRIHQLLAWAFVAGLALHVTLVLFFAGYVADGRDIYWWHFTAWDF